MSVQQNSSLRLQPRLALSALAGPAVGAAVAAFSPGSFWTGWLAGSLLAAVGIFALLSAWKWAGGTRMIGWMIALAFLVRLVSGIGLSLALPVYGYDTECQNIGYLFKDACERDQEAFSVALKGEGLYWFSGIKLDSDQYGGLAFLSGWVYRYLSPDAHRSFLILLLGSIAAALGVPFLFRAITTRWSMRVAALAGWIYVFYPDAIFFASSQMREPFLVGLSALAFWAMITWEQNWRRSAVVFALSAAAMFFFSFRVALMVAGILAVWFWLEFSSSRSSKQWQALGWAGLAAGLLVMGGLTWEWFTSSAAWDVTRTMSGSGWLTKIIEEVGEQFRLPVVIVYGLAQPVLPAAIAETAESGLWKAIGIVRATGWYALAPFLIYSLFVVWKEPDARQRRALIWLAAGAFFWMVISAVRGGGDQVDNPRYRSLFIPWLALLAAWSIDWAISHRDAWLWRWLAVEAVFLGFFTNWYFSRYFHAWGRLPFWTMVIWIIVLSGAIILGGWVYDRLRGRGVPRPENRAQLPKSK